MEILKSMLANWDQFKPVRKSLTVMEFISVIFQDYEKLLCLWKLHGTDLEDTGMLCFKRDDVTERLWCLIRNEEYCWQI